MFSLIYILFQSLFAGINVLFSYSHCKYRKIFAVYLAHFFFKILFIHERHRERQRHRQKGKQAPCRVPDAGLDPRTPGSCSELKADA